ncbi:MAG: FKBP-type peptidyl-prolyl cis-trans isomerase [Desulfobacterales bacterium]
MKHAKTILVAAVAVFPFLVWAADKTGSPAPAPKNFEEKISYVMGREIGQSLGEAPIAVDINTFIRGMQDAIQKRPSALTPADEETVKAEFSARMQAVQAAKTAALAEENRKSEDAFLAKNKSAKGVVTTASGLQYEVLKPGTGAKPKETDRVKVNYRGTLLDGTEFDSSYARNQPAVFAVNGVIAGWTEGLQLMPLGGKYRLWVPSKLAYGERGAGRAIGPNALLVFEVEPLEIVNN